MSLALNTTCLECHFQRNLTLARSLGGEEQSMAFARALMKMYLEAPEAASSPWLSHRAAILLREHYGLDEDRYRQEKIDSNRFVMERFALLRQQAAQAEDPVTAGLKLAILGNYLDFSALRGQVSFEKLNEMLDAAMEMELDSEMTAELKGALERGKRLLYITDNAGEIGFDRIFAEEIAKKYPQLAITFCVRGGIAQNDATREDAAAVGVPFPVIDNGNCVPGTQMDMLGKDAREALEKADVIIAKGMANVETMFGCGYPVFYAFLIKCQRFVELFGKPLFTPMLLKEQR